MAWIIPIVIVWISVHSLHAEPSVSTMLQLRDSVQFSYDTTNLFLDLIRGDRPPTTVLETFTNIMANQRSDSRVPFRTIEPVVTAYVGYGICLVVGLLFAILMPIVGFIFCCARCCGRCGGRVHQMDAKKDPCRRVVYTICTVVIVTVQLVAIVLAFINHFLLHEAMVNHDPRLGAFSKLNDSLADTETSLDEMFKMAVNASTVNLEPQKKRFISIVEGDLKEFQKEFILQSKAESVLTPIASLKSTVEAFDVNTEAVAFFNQFHSDLSSLLPELPAIRQRLVDKLDTDCPLGHQVECSRLMDLVQTKLTTRYTLGQYQIEDWRKLVGQIQRHINEVENLNEFNKTLNGLDRVIKAAIQDDLDRAWTDLAQSPSTREKLAQSFKAYLDQIYTILRKLRARLAMEDDRNAQDTFIRFVEFRFYGGIAILCIPVLIFLLIYLGLCFGTCGHRPYEEAGFCNRGVGANLLLAGVGFVFLFSTILMLVCTALFLLGGPVQTEACRYLTGRVPDGPRKLDDYLHSAMQYMIDQVRREEKIRQQQEQPYKSKSEVSPHLELVLNITRARLADAILTRCANEPFVDAISGGQIFWPALHEPVQVILQQLMDAYKETDLVSPMEQTIQICEDSLAHTNFLDSINFTQAINQAGLPVTDVNDMEGLIVRLRNLNVPALGPHISELEQKILRLDRARTEAHHLYTKLDSIPGLRQQLRFQLSEYKRNLPESIRSTMDIGLKKLRPLLENELQLAVIATWREIPCQSLRVAVRGGVDAICEMTIMPLNAFWAALGLTLLLFIPLVIFAVKLAGLYRKTEKYSSDYEEPDYISYHGFYMRPSTETQPVSQKPRNKMRKHKGYSLVPQQV